MMAVQRRLCTALLLWQGISAVIAGPVVIPDADQRQHPLQAVTAAPRNLKGRFLHITDLHPDEFYRVHSSTSEEDTCHRGKGAAGTFGAETSDCDSPLSLVNATFDWIAANLQHEIDFVIWTGDSARHDSDEEIPRSPAQVLGTNRLVADKFAATFADPSGPGGLAIPVVPTLGNNDILPHNILLPGPNKWLKYYTDIWRRFIPEEQRHSFDFGGWFYVEVIPGKLAVVSLNTLYFFDRNAGVDDCATPSEPGYKQMEWLRVQLQFLRSRGMKAILMGHVPPARTESKKLWDETCWQKYTLWLQQFRDVVTGGIFGHMNIDHFLLQDTQDVDIGVVTGSSEAAAAADVRVAMEDELSAQGTADYLQELRIAWSNLVEPVTGGAGDAGRRKKGRKGRKGKKPADAWAERYQLSLVGPSIVPNYFPTLRVVEYNITGLEDAATWADAADTIPAPIEHNYYEEEEEEEEEEATLDLRDIDASKKKKNGGNKKKHSKKPHKKPGNKKPKDKKPHDPHLIIPLPPSKSALPGPAYSPQPLTLTGYTQYFANLTHINNDVTPDDSSFQSRSSGVRDTSTWSAAVPEWLLKWRRGRHGDKEPKDPEQPRPRDFRFEVEYSTHDDRLYKLDDLTVGSFVRLARRMARKPGDGEGAVVVGVSEGGLGLLDGERWDGIDDEQEVDELDDDDSDDDVDVSGEEDDLGATKKGDDGKKGKKKHGGKKKKGKGGKKKKKANKVWLHFLRHAFVSTVEKDELKKMA